MSEKPRGRGDRGGLCGVAGEIIHPCLDLSLSTHSAVWEQSLSPDQTCRAEAQHTPQPHPPSPEDALSARGPAFLSTQRWSAWRQRCCWNPRAGPS